VPPFGVVTDPEAAALVLGMLAHAMELDDLHPSLIGHPSSVLVPVILAVGPLVQATGEHAISAYVAGAEFAAHLGRAVASDQYRRGWHTTSTIGVLAAAATSARLMGLESETTAHALGLAASAAAGVRANFGSNAKPFHVGQAASQGVTAALLSRAGLKASPTALDDLMGYLDNFVGNRFSGTTVADNLGKKWELVDPGLQIKLYACCGAAHRPVDALLDLVDQERLTFDEVEEVIALVDPIASTLLEYPEPITTAEARFSLQHCLAAVMVDGRLSLEHFTCDALERDDLRELGRRVHVKIHPELVKHKEGLAFAEIQVILGSGVHFTRRTYHPRGSGQRPLSQDELEKKFFDCVHLYAPEKDWNPALQALHELSSDGTVAAVVEALTVVS
jgi:2-methylcitrate dehydratase PrpD